MAGPNQSPQPDNIYLWHADKDSSSDADSFALDEVCEDDRCNTPNATIWHCVDCDSNYCSECWAYQGPHKAGKYGRDGVPHEKTNVKVVSRLKRILQPPRTPEAIQKCHDADQCTKWFGKKLLVVQCWFFINAVCRRLSRYHRKTELGRLWPVCHFDGQSTAD